MIAWEEVLR